MQLGLKLLVKVLLCSLIYGCYGAPPKNAEQNSDDGTKSRYTDDEDKFIVEELSSLIDDFIEGESNEVWFTLTKNFREKFEAGTPGFPQERTGGSLRARFHEVLLHNHPHVNVKVPEKLKQKFKHKKLVKERAFANRDWYNSVEDDFIIEELRKPSYTHIGGSWAWKKIKAEHDKKRLLGAHGFEIERSLVSLHRHVLRMRKKGQFSKEVQDRFKPWFRGGPSTSKPAVENQDINLQGEDEELDDDEIARIFLQMKYPDVEGDATKQK